MNKTKIWLVVTVDGERLMQATALTHVPRVGEQLFFRDTGMCTVRQVMHSERSPIGDIALYLEPVSPLDQELPVVPEKIVPLTAAGLRAADWRDFQHQWWTTKVDTSV